MPSFQSPLQSPLPHVCVYKAIVFVVLLPRQRFPSPNLNCDHIYLPSFSSSALPLSSSQHLDPHWPGWYPGR